MCFSGKALLIALMYFPIVVLITWVRGDISLIFWWVIERRIMGVLSIEYVFTILPFFVASLANWSARLFPKIFECPKHY